MNEGKRRAPRTTIASDGLLVETTAFGAEMTSLRTRPDDVEHLWQGDPAVWGGQSPVLFPFVGALAGRGFTHRGRFYPMRAHGFARDSQFECVDRSETLVAYRLTERPDTLSSYPFPFELVVAHSVAGRTVTIAYEVRNRGRERMPFSIGGHPGLALPLGPEGVAGDFLLEFERPESCDRWVIDPATHLLLQTPEPFDLPTRRLPLATDLFARDALVLERFRSSRATLLRADGRPLATVSFRGFPQLGIWSKPGAPFVCIEPWFGLDDRLGFEGELSAKKGILRLEPGEIFRCSFSILVH